MERESLFLLPLFSLRECFNLVDALKSEFRSFLSSLLNNTSKAVAKPDETHKVTIALAQNNWRIYKNIAADRWQFTLPNYLKFEPKKPNFQQKSRKFYLRDTIHIIYQMGSSEFTLQYLTQYNQSIQRYNNKGDEISLHGLGHDILDSFDKIFYFLWSISSRRWADSRNNIPPNPCMYRISDIYY